VWGMNVGVPGEGDPADFYVVVGAMALILIAMATYFRRRGWL
jgi:Mg2+ and Co2+ transporter CorA